MAASAGRGRGQDEADDEGAQGGHQGPANAVSPGEQEGEGPAARRTGRAHRLPPLLCGGGAGWPRCAGGGLRGREERRARQRPRVYDEAVRSVLRQVWLIMDCICGKRLAILAKGEDYDPQAWRRWSPTAAQIAVAALGDAA